MKFIKTRSTAIYIITSLLLLFISNINQPLSLYFQELVSTTYRVMPQLCYEWGIVIVFTILIILKIDLLLAKKIIGKVFYFEISLVLIAIINMIYAYRYIGVELKYYIVIVISSLYCIYKSKKLYKN